LNARIIQLALSSVENEAGRRPIDFMLAKAILLTASATDPVIDEKTANLIRKKKFFFSMMANDWGLRQYGAKVREAINDVLLKPDNVLHNEVANAIIASRSPAAKARAIEMLEKPDSFMFWPIHALLTGWGANDPEVAAAIARLSSVPPEQAQYFAQYVPAITSDKTAARERLLTIAWSPKLVRLDFVTAGFSRLGIDSTDSEVMDALLSHEFSRTGVYDASDVLIANFGDDPRVRTIAVERIKRLEAPWAGIARAYEDDPELRSFVLLRVGTLPTRLRSVIVSQAARRCDDRTEFRELLEKYGSEEQRDCRNAAALGYYEFVARSTTDLTRAEERLNQEIVTIGPYMDDIRQSAFLGLAAIGKASTISSIEGLEKGGLNFFDTINDSPTMLSYVARNWKKFKEDLGSDGFWRLNRHYSKEWAAWQQLAPYAAESAQIREDFLAFARTHPARLGADGIESLSRISPRSELLRDHCLRALDGRHESESPYDATRTSIIAGRVLGVQYSGDDDVRARLEAYRFPSSTVVIALSLGWPTSSKLQELFDLRQANTERVDAADFADRLQDYTLPAVLHLLGARSSSEQFLNAINQVIEQCTGDIWEFGEYLTLPITTRLGEDAAFASVMMDALSKSPTPHQKASFVRLLASSGVQQDALRAWCEREYRYQFSRPHIQEYGFDLIAGSARAISHSILDVLTPDLN
jgi:hypothetical protein